MSTWGCVGKRTRKSVETPNIRANSRRDQLSFALTSVSVSVRGLPKLSGEEGKRTKETSTQRHSAPAPCKAVGPMPARCKGRLHSGSEVRLKSHLRC